MGRCRARTRVIHRVDRKPVTCEAGTAAPSGRTVNLGGGHIVPYPEPSNATATTIGKANRRTDTKPEIRLRSALHRQGLRFRKDLLVRAGDVRVRPDVVFTRQKVALFVDGCFWHGCPEHQHVPRSNRDYWVPKLQANEARDRRVDAALDHDGWTTIRVWEHEPVAIAVDRIEEAVLARRKVSATWSNDAVAGTPTQMISEPTP